MEACTPRPDSHELRFQPLCRDGRPWAFPCDAGGRVDMDALTERARIDYLYARTVIGREFGRPALMPRAALA